MQNYISLLRGINVSGKNMIRMTDLKLLYDALGLRNIETYIQSGNVVFSLAIEQDPASLEKQIEEAITKKFGYTVPVIIRTAGGMHHSALNNPFLGHQGINTEKLYITFLKDNPDPDNLKKLQDVQHPPDEFIVTGKEIFVHCPDRYGETKLSNAFFENKLKVSATTRNWKTVLTLIQTAHKEQ